jgi:hypothetical protein
LDEVYSLDNDLNVMSTITLTTPIFINGSSDHLYSGKEEIYIYGHDSGHVFHLDLNTQVQTTFTDFFVHVAGKENGLFVNGYVELDADSNVGLMGWGVHDGTNFYDTLLRSQSTSLGKSILVDGFTPNGDDGQNHMDVVLAPWRARWYYAYDNKIEVNNGFAGSIPQTFVVGFGDLEVKLPEAFPEKTIEESVPQIPNTETEGSL